MTLQISMYAVVLALALIMTASSPTPSPAPVEHGDGDTTCVDVTAPPVVARHLAGDVNEQRAPHPVS